MMIQAGSRRDMIPTMSASLGKGLVLLRQAYHYARDVDSDPWQFAVEYVVLEKAGMTCVDLRWLVHKGFAEHGHEVSLSDSPNREFRGVGSASFRKRSCFRLTEAGSQFADETLTGNEKVSRSGAASTKEAHPPSQTRAAEDPDVDAGNGRATCHGSMPDWNGERHQLRVGASIVKEFKVPSANQEAILTAFQEEGWPERIDDPLSPTGRIDPKRRLHDAIKGLNRNQRVPLVRFHGDGTGEGVRWVLVSTETNGTLVEA